MEASSRIEGCTYPLAFRCPQRWEALSLTDDDGIRHCEVCAQRVHLCATDEEARRHAEQGHCIAYAVLGDGWSQILVVGTPEPLGYGEPDQ